MRRRNQRGNCGLIVLVLVVILGLILAWVWIASERDDQRKCEALKSWYASNPYDTNPDIKREYEYRCHG